MQDTVKKIVLGVSGVALVCYIIFCGFYFSHKPMALDKLITYDVPEGYNAENEIGWNNGNSVIVEKDYAEAEGDGYLSVSVFAYKGYECVTGISNRVDIDECIESLNDSWNYKVGKHIFIIGMSDSDDMPNMKIRAFVKNGNYVYEFGLSNSDAQVTPEQEDIFREFIRTIKFGDE